MEQLQNPEMFWRIGLAKTLYIKDDTVAVRYLFHDCDPETTAWALTTRSLMHARRVLAETCLLQSWPDVPASFSARLVGVHVVGKCQVSKYKTVARHDLS
jgi:hypothetical protein